MDKFNKQVKGSSLKKAFSLSKTSTTSKSVNFNISFEHFDNNQIPSSNFEEWEEVGLLSRTLDVLQLCSTTSLQNQKHNEPFIMYGDFPSNEISNYVYPSHVPLDAYWAEIKITGPTTLVGHIIKNTFYIVFLDKTRNFCLKKGDIV